MSDQVYAAGWFVRDGKVIGTRPVLTNNDVVEIDRKLCERRKEYEATIATRQEFTTLDPSASRPLEATADNMALMHDAGLSEFHGESIPFDDGENDIHTTHPSIRSCDKCGLTEYCNCSRDEDRDTADWQEYDRWSKRIDEMIDEFDLPNHEACDSYGNF